MEESCKFCPSTVKQNNKSNTRIHSFKCKHSDSNKTFLESITKDETSHRIKKVVPKNSLFKNNIGNGKITIKRIIIKNTPIGNITRYIKKINKRPERYILKLPKMILEPKTYTIHECNYSCVNWTKYEQNKTKPLNILAIPLYFGFKRHTINGNGYENSKIYYETPCGVNIRNIEKMMQYLITTKSKMSIDLFDFNSCVDPLAKFGFLTPKRFLKDLSKGSEFRLVSCLNGIDREMLPKIKYITNRQAATNVNLNLDTNFLCGCDCSDNCQDKSKCACWKNTIDGLNSIPNYEIKENVGYNYRRLYNSLPTGIYECNKACKCNSLCLNRVVQQPLRLNLQLFKTEKKGWGVRSLNDLPKGTFICCYTGNILTETDATEQGLNYGDEYMADLDFIEKIEKHKEGYEEFALPMDDENSASDNALQLESRNPKLMTFKKSVCNYFDKDNSEFAMDAKNSGNIGRFFNHSCSPNLFIQNVFVDTHDLRFPWISFFSKNFIKAGTELTWDYGYEAGSLPGKTIACYCNSVKCKRRLL